MPTLMACCRSELLQVTAGETYMGKSGSDAVRVTTTLTRQQHADLEQIAEANSVKVAWLVRRSVERLIDQAQGPLFSLDLRREKNNA